MTWRQSIFAALLLLSPNAALAQGWSLNLAYNNPPGASLGANVLYFWQNVGLEVGLGWVHLESVNTGGSTSDDDTATFALLGDINLKYFFGAGNVRPYVQGGFGLGISGGVGRVTGFGAGIGSPFFGGGLMLGSRDLYFYGSYNHRAGGYFPQFGVGFGF